MADQVNPNPGILLYTRIKKSPYYYASRRHGVQLYSVYNHHYHPRHYRDPFEEYWQLLEGVTLWDVGGAERQVEITGPDAFTFTNMLTPRNLHKCDVGQCKYAFITDQHGGIINDPVLIRLEENHFWLSLADSDVLLWCRGLAVNAGLDVQISEPDVGPLQVQGPKSKEVMTDLFGADILDVPYYYMVRPRAGRHAARDHPHRLHGRARLRDLPVRRQPPRRSSCGTPLIEAGEPHGLVPIGPCHIRRIEGGILAHGCDMTIDENPYEVGYGYKWMVELEQEQDFIGREALRDVSRRGRHAQAGRRRDRRIQARRLQRRLDAGLLPGPGRRRDVGKVTSACHSPRLDKNIGYAMVSVDHSDERRRARDRAPRGDGRGRRRRPRVLQARARRRGARRPRHREQRLATCAAGAAPAPAEGRRRRPPHVGRRACRRASFFDISVSRRLPGVSGGRP